MRQTSLAFELFDPPEAVEVPCDRTVRLGPRVGGRSGSGGRRCGTAGSDTGKEPGS